MTVKISIEHNGKTYGAEIMRIKSTRLGIQDHGIWTADLHCEGAHTSVRCGGYTLDGIPREIGGAKRRVGAAFGMDHIMQICEAVGVEKWEDLPGKALYVLFEGESMWGSTALGIANIDTGKAMIFSEHAQMWRDCGDHPLIDQEDLEHWESL